MTSDFERNFAWAKDAVIRGIIPGYTVYQFYNYCCGRCGLNDILPMEEITEHWRRCVNHE